MKKKPLLFRATGKFGNNEIVKLNKLVVGTIEYKVSKKDKINKWEVTITLCNEPPARFPSKFWARSFMRNRVRSIIAQLNG